jgi:hypothetical protein
MATVLLVFAASCASVPPSSPTSGPTPILVGRSEKDGDQNIKYWFISVDGKRSTKITSGRHLLVIGFRRQGSWWNDNTGLHAKGEVYAELKAGRRYTVAGSYHLRDFGGTYYIIDTDSAEEVSEHFEVEYVPGSPPPILLPIFIAK